MALTHQYAVLHASFSPDGHRLATASAEWKGGEVRIWSCDTGELVQAFPQDSAHGVFFSPDGKKGLTIVLADALLKAGPIDKPPTVLHHKTVVDWAGFSPDSAYLLTTTHDMTARLWETSTGEPLSPPLRHDARIWHTSFSADSRRWRTACHNGIVRTWSIARSGGPTRALPHDGVVHRLALSPDGRRAVTSCRDHTVRVWDLATGRELARRRHADLVWRPVFSPEGRWVLSASDDGIARVWDSATGKMAIDEVRHGLRGSPLGLWTAFSPDGQYLVVAGGSAEGERGQGAARVWEVKTGRAASPPLVHGQVVVTAEFSPDGRRLLTGSNGGAFVWDLEKAAVQVGWAGRTWAAIWPITAATAAAS